MISIPLVDDLFELFRGANRRPTLILLCSAVMIVTWKTAGTQTFYHRHVAELVGASGNPAENAAWYQMGMALLLLGVVPACLVRLGFGASLTSVGLGLGNVKRGLCLFALAAPFILWIAWYFSGVAEFRAIYPFNRVAGRSDATFAAHLVGLAVLYLGWEFHFRGFLQQGLGGSLGPSAAMGIQILASSLLHFDRPDVELWASIPAALLWGLQANYTGAIWAGFAEHWLLGAALDYFICFR